MLQSSFRWHHCLSFTPPLCSELRTPKRRSRSAPLLCFQLCAPHLRSAQTPDIPGTKDGCTSHPEDWETWSQRFAFFMTYHEVPSEVKEKPLLLSACGNATLKLASKHLAPKDIMDTETTTSQILAVLKKHLAPKPSKWAHHLALCKRIQKPGESAADFLVVL